jgi:hypothetical protein
MSGQPCPNCGAPLATHATSGTDGHAVCGNCGVRVAGGQRTELDVFDSGASVRSQRSIRYSGRVEEALRASQLAASHQSQSQRFSGGNTLQQQQTESLSSPLSGAGNRAPLSLDDLSLSGGLGGAESSSPLSFSQLALGTLHGNQSQKGFSGESASIAAPSLPLGHSQAARERTDVPAPVFSESERQWFSFRSKVFAQKSNNTRSQFQPSPAQVFDVDHPVGVAEDTGGNLVDFYSNSSLGGEGEPDRDPVLAELERAISDAVRVVTGSQDGLDGQEAASLFANRDAAEQRRQVVIEATPVELSTAFLPRHGASDQDVARAQAALARQPAGPHYLDILQHVLVAQITALVDDIGAAPQLWDVAFTLWQRFVTWYVQLKQRSILSASVLRLAEREGVNINVDDVLERLNFAASAPKKRAADGSLSAPTGGAPPPAPLPPQQPAGGRKRPRSDSHLASESDVTDASDTDGVPPRAPAAAPARALGSMPPPLARATARPFDGKVESVHLFRLSNELRKQVFVSMSRLHVDAPSPVDAAGLDGEHVRLFETADGCLKPELTLGLLSLALSILNEPVFLHDILRWVARGTLPFVGGMSGMLSVSRPRNDADTRFSSLDKLGRTEVQVDAPRIAGHLSVHQIPTCDVISRIVVSLCLVFDLSIEPIGDTLRRIRGDEYSEPPLHAPWVIPRTPLALGAARIAAQLGLPTCMANFSVCLAYVLEQTNARRVSDIVQEKSATETNRSKSWDAAEPACCRIVRAVDETNGKYLATKSKPHRLQAFAESRLAQREARVACAALVVVALKLVYARALSGEKVPGGDSPESFWGSVVSTFGGDGGDGGDTLVPSLSALFLTMNDAVRGGKHAVDVATVEAADYACQVAFSADLLSRRNQNNKLQRVGTERILKALRGVLAIPAQKTPPKAARGSQHHRRSFSSRAKKGKTPTKSCVYHVYSHLGRRKSDPSSLPRPYSMLIRLVASLIFAPPASVNSVVFKVEQQLLLPYLLSTD